MATSKQVKDFFALITPLAMEECRKRGYSWVQAVTCACQSAQETGYGTSKLMTKANAFFGIKATKTWKGKVYSSQTQECYDGVYATVIAAFRAYDGVSDSVRDYFDFIEGARYRASLTATTVKDCITLIKAGGYATDPNYVSNILSIYERNREQLESYREVKKMSIFSPVCTDIYDFGTSHSNPRSQDGIKAPTKLIPHHMAGVMDALACAKMHKRSSTTNGSSASYYISDDRIVGAISEDRRPWTSGGKSVGGKSGRWADFRGITVEVSNNKNGNPKSDKGWTISDKSYRSLVRLFADVCTRWNLIPHYDGTQNGTLCEHRQFAATGCPGEQLHNLIVSGQLEKDILKEMGKKPTPTPTPTPKPGVVFRAQIGAFKNLSGAKSYGEAFKSKHKLTYTVRKEGAYYKVLHPETGFSTKGDAELSAGALRNMGYKGAFVVPGSEE